MAHIAQILFFLKKIFIITIFLIYYNNWIRNFNSKLFLKLH